MISRTRRLRFVPLARRRDRIARNVAVIPRVDISHGLRSSSRVARRLEPLQRPARERRPSLHQTSRDEHLHRSQRGRDHARRPALHRRAQRRQHGVHLRLSQRVPASARRRRRPRRPQPLKRPIPRRRSHRIDRIDDVRVFLRPARALDALERALDDVHRARWHLLDSLRNPRLASPSRARVARSRAPRACGLSLARVRPSARARRRASRCRGRGFLDGGRRSSSLRASRRAMSYFALTIVSANDVPIYARDFTAREDDGARAEVRPEASERANE